MNIARIPARSVAPALVAPKRVPADRGLRVDRFERSEEAPEPMWRSAPKARIDQRILISTVSPSLLGVMAGVPAEMVSPTVLAMAAELGIEEDQAALREADRAPEAIVTESTAGEVRWVFARSRRLVSRTLR